VILCRCRTSRSLPLVWLWLAAAAGIAADPASEEAEPPRLAAPPERIAGLQAWFKTDSLHASLRDGDAVSTWPDSSGSGRHLTGDGQGLPTIFEVRRIGDHAVVRAGKANHFAVANPPYLDDHTVFLVYDTARPVGLFDGGVPDQDGNGVALGQDAVCRFGNTSAPYGRDLAPGAGFRITVLGRASGNLHAFVNGRDVSSGQGLRGRLRMGRLFELRQTRYAVLDGLGLQVAEMLFYDRYLTDDERGAVTRYLSEKYAIELAPEPGAVLRTTLPQIVSPTGGHRIRWDEQVEIHPPLTHDPQGANSRLGCTRDDTRVRLSVSLAVSDLASASEVRVLVLENGAEYSSDAVTSGPTAGASGASVDLRTTVTLDAGDFLEIVVFAPEGGGEVTVDPVGSVLRAEILP
jgi:hypothetical protein